MPISNSTETEDFIGKFFYPSNDVRSCKPLEVFSMLCHRRGACENCQAQGVGSRWTGLFGRDPSTPQAGSALRTDSLRSGWRTGI